MRWEEGCRRGGRWQGVIKGGKGGVGDGEREGNDDREKGWGRMSRR